LLLHHNISQISYHKVKRHKFLILMGNKVEKNMKTIYFNGKVYTGGEELRQAFVVRDGSFMYVGDSRGAKQLAVAGDELVDLQGRFVCPGFNDSHMHVLGFGKLLRDVQLAGHTDSLGEMIRYLKEKAAEAEGAWILGRGWNQDYFTDVTRMPNRYDLDEVSKERPICIVRCCGHGLVVNSKALEILNLPENFEQPEGGSIDLENGRFYDNAMELISQLIPAPDKDEIKKMILASCKRLNEYGITSCHTDDYSAFSNVDWSVVHEAYKELEAEGKLTVRIYEQSNITSLEGLSRFINAGHVTGTGSDRYQFGPLKMLGDGALGARTAFLSIPYADDPSTSGIPVYSKELMESMISYAHKNGMQIAVHTIGDACLDWVLSAYEKALAEFPREDHRHGIIHCQIMRPDQWEKIKALKLHVYVQTIFLDYDINIVEQRVGKELAETSYCWKSLMKDGVTVSNGSDAPVELPDVMAGIQCAVTRKTLNGSKEYLAKEAFTVKEAIDSYTIQSAKASFVEDKKGRIQEGMHADFVILDENLFEIPKEKIKDVKVLETYLGGYSCYRRS